MIASGSSDQSIKLYDLRTHTLIQHYSDAHVGSSAKGQFAGGVNSVSFGGASAEWLISTGMDSLVKVFCVMAKRM